MDYWYRLVDRVPVVEPDPYGSDFFTWLENPDNRRVQLTQIGDGHTARRATISTVFLTTPHYLNGRWDGLFETMVFSEILPDLDEECERYRTWNDAVAGHQAMVARVTEALDVLDAQGVGVGQ